MVEKERFTGPHHMSLQIVTPVRLKWYQTVYMHLHSFFPYKYFIYLFIHSIDHIQQIMNNASTFDMIQECTCNYNIVYKVILYW